MRTFHGIEGYKRRPLVCVGGGRRGKNGPFGERLQALRGRPIQNRGRTQSSVPAPLRSAEALLARERADAPRSNQTSFSQEETEAMEEIQDTKLKLRFCFHEVLISATSLPPVKYLITGRRVLHQINQVSFYRRAQRQQR